MTSETVNITEHENPPFSSAFVLQWQSLAMAAPAFWYFRTRKQAEAACRQMANTTQRVIRRVRVPATTPFSMMPVVGAQRKGRKR